MKLILVVLILFLLAFVGLAAGLLLKRRGLRSACGHVKNSRHDCKCEADLDRELQGQPNCTPDRHEQCHQRACDHDE